MSFKAAWKLKLRNFHEEITPIVKIFLVLMLCRYQTYTGQRTMSLTGINYIHELAKIFKILILTQCLSLHGVSFPVNWVNVEWDPTSIESMQIQTQCQQGQREMIELRKHILNHQKFYKFIQTLHRLSYCGVSLRGWFCWWGVLFHVDSVCGQSDMTKRITTGEVNYLWRP